MPAQHPLACLYHSITVELRIVHHVTQHQKDSCTNSCTQQESIVRNEMWRKQRWAISLYLTDPTAMTTDIQRAVTSMYYPVSASAIGRWLQDAGLHERRLLQHLPLTPRQHRPRLQWCCAECHGVNQWVIFSDKSCFCLGEDNQWIRVWRHPG